MDNLQVLIDFIFDKEEDAEQRDKWGDMISQYKTGMKILRKRSEYTTQDITVFQNLMDGFSKNM